MATKCSYHTHNKTTVKISIQYVQQLFIPTPVMNISSTIYSQGEDASYRNKQEPQPTFLG